MATLTHIPLQTTKLTGSQSAVTFSSIPSTYRDLVLVAKIQVSSSGGVVVRVNNDSGNNYPVLSMYGEGTNKLAVREQYTSAQLSYFASFPTTGYGSMIINFIDYSATDKNKSMLARSNVPAGVAFTAGLWNSTAAINSISIFSPSRNFTAGSEFSLYGIEA